MLKERSIRLRDWILDNTKIVLPIVLVVCVIITVLVALNANEKELLEQEAEKAAAAVADMETPEKVVGGITSPVFDLEKNAYPEVNDIVRTYYDAQASGDIDTILSLNQYVDDIEKIRVEELSKYIESYPVIDVYTKPGMTENSYVAFVYAEVKFRDAETALPGMKIYYIGQDENGNFYINDEMPDDTIFSYVKEVCVQNDAVDLNNKVAVAFNDLLASDEELMEYVAYLREKINEDVGEILAKAENPDAAEQLLEEMQNKKEEEVVPSGNIVEQTVKTTAVVNIRTSDSETADKLDKAQIGQEFKLLEARGNGWSKVAYNGREAFIKSDYLEVVSEVVIDNKTEEPAGEPKEDKPKEEVKETTENTTVSGTVKVIENVKIRKGASTSSAALATAYKGDKLDLIQKQADGWTKIKYKGQIAYVKSDYVE